MAWEQYGITQILRTPSHAQFLDYDVMEIWNLFVSIVLKVLTQMNTVHLAADDGTSLSRDKLYENGGTKLWITTVLWMFW
jgi:hypothetical protein